jgi:hypothetical protein
MNTKKTSLKFVPKMTIRVNDRVYQKTVEFGNRSYKIVIPSKKRYTRKGSKGVQYYEM